MSVQDGFRQLLDNLKLDPDEVALARQIHNDLSQLLIDKGVAVRCRLQGSFARKTMLRPLKDVDKIIELRAEHEPLLREAGGPRKAYDLIMQAVNSMYPDAYFEPKKHALCIHLPGCPFEFDAVPAFNTAATDDGFIEIADTEAWAADDQWVESNTYLLMAAIRKRNDECDGKFIHQVRIVKQIFKTQNIHIPGLHIETYAYRAITTTTDHPEAVTRILTKALAMLDGNYTDPTGFDQISDKLDQGAKMTAQLRLPDLIDKARQAQTLAANGDEYGAEIIWKQMIGDNYPQPAPPSKDAIAGLFKGTGSIVAGVASTTQPTHRPVPTRSWRP